ncbi:MAG TPA: OadG family protein [Candidatus Eisenbergiella merdipullorum]|uniref:OadG family protein n=1 Tax=Candidatus Eisenbergiella merdipullorum TaxID=2838553 RepID=A0A9D2L134_9FIRM|nr:OadG family protein [Candidatus Eisenbergiella merdipullorum]
MKRKLLTLVMALICVFTMTACSGEDDSAANAESMYGITEESAVNYADQVISSIQAIAAQNMQDQYASDAVISSALDSWTSAMEDIGEVKSFSDYKVSADKDGVTINVHVNGSDHDAEVVITLDDELSLSSITTNVEYSFGELMQNAALNTILGMGTVFVILILICLIIYCFNFIPKIQASFSKGEKKQEEKKTAAPAAPAAAAVENAAGQNPADDHELVAVIAAAIAASEGAASPEGFVVRSIRRVPASRWKANK